MSKAAVCSALSAGFTAGDEQCQPPVATASSHLWALALLVLAGCGGNTSAENGEPAESRSAGGKAMATSESAAPAAGGAASGGASASMQPGKHVGLLGGKSLYTDGATSLPALRASDFTSITFGKLSISRDGALFLDDELLFAGGRYVGEPAWPALAANLRTSATSLRRLEVLVGPVDGANVSELARNFRALKSTLPDVVAVALDDDSVRDVDATVRFGVLLGSLGFKLSLVASPRSPELWGELYERLSTTPELIERLLLDLDPNGVENDVANWSKWFSALPIEPGWSGRHGDDCSLGNAPEVITSKAFFMRDKVGGAWVRLLDDMPSCSTQYAPTSYARAIEDAWTFQP